MQRQVIIADTHCGSRSGLTPPDYQFSRNSKNRTRRKFAEMQARVWDWYLERMQALQPIDCLVVNGDAIDGKGERSGGTELLEADRHEQAAIAAECIQVAKAKKIVIIRGTPYHAGREEDFENTVAQLCGADKIGDHEWTDCGGVIFDFKHKVISSVIPHGRNTAPNRAALWNALWAERGLQPKARVIIRSHVHYFTHGGDARRLVMTTPALQGWTKYGGKECEGTTDLGLLSFDCDGGAYSWLFHELDMQWAAAKPFKV